MKKANPNTIFSVMEDIKEGLKDASIKAGIEHPVVYVEHPDDISHGDFSSNVALIYSKKLKANPKILAGKIVEEFNKILTEKSEGKKSEKKSNIKNEIEKEHDFSKIISSVDIAGPGFINIKLADNFFTKEIIKISSDYGENYVKSNVNDGQKIMVEYTDPNPFKEFHIGHLMSNAIGESIARILEFSGANIKRANWQGDVGLHVAKAIWGAIALQRQEEAKQSIERDIKENEVKSNQKENADLGIAFWGKAYAFGAKKYDSDEPTKKDIGIINKKIYNREDSEINALYDKGRKESLQHFESIYKKLGTKFDNYFFEGKEGNSGEGIVREFIKKGVFEESEGAVIFPGEKYGVHTRVFITSQGLPTYETKEIGLNTEKFKIYPDLSQSIIITANEQSDYFRVLFKVFSLIRPEIFQKTKHISHGMMRLTTSKMGSRTSNVITAEHLMGEMEKLIEEKIKDRDFDDKEKGRLCEEVAIGAIKYQILRQAIGGDIIYDPKKSISFEGDSGPYLQYACVRAMTVLKKAKEAGILE